MISGMLCSKLQQVTVRGKLLGTMKRLEKNDGQNTTEKGLDENIPSC